LPCNCKGGIVIHKTCLLDIVTRNGEICSICQTKYRAKSYLSVDEEGCILRISVHNNNRVKYHENEHGQKHGSYIEYYEKTALVKQKCYYVNDVIHGPYEKLFRNGSIAEKSQYVNGVFDGLCETWHENGKLQSRRNYNHGKLDGLYEEWYEGGQLRAHCNYEDGKLHGIYETFYENGQIHSRGIYVHGKLDGIYQIWNEKGKLENSYTYDNNNLYDDSYNNSHNE